MAYDIKDIEGIGPSYAAKLASADITTTDDLLTRCCDTKGRTDVSTKTGVGEGVLLKWANMADLMRIKGVGSEYSELLEAAGVDTVKELGTRNADNLTAKMKEVQQEKRITRTAPGVSTVSRWVAQAKQMDPTISH